MIVINGRYLSQRITGIQRFAYEITNALMQMADVLVLAPQDICAEYAIQNWNIQRIGGNGSHLWEQVTLARYMRKHHPGDVLLNLSGLSPLGYANSILTIHDLSYLLKPRSCSRMYRLYYQLMTPLAARRAKQILTVSNFSKSEICQYLHIDANKIEVVYNAVHPYPLAEKKEMPRYILSVCSLAPRKNLERLIKAYQMVENKDFELYLIGGNDHVFADPNLEAYRTAPHIHFLGYVDDATLRLYYRNAIAYVNASIYEGFGIPNLEAMQQQCPVVVSHIPAYTEICGDAALYLDPYSEQDICEKMVTITHDEQLRETLIHRQEPQLKRFSWEQSAEKIVESLKLKV